jgi:hypothetical protein
VKSGWNGWLNSDPWISASGSTKAGLGAGSGFSILGFEVGFSGDIYTYKKSGSISSSGEMTSTNSRIMSLSANLGVVGVGWERNFIKQILIV